MLTLAGLSSAEEKLWTWKPQDVTATHVLHAYALNEKGGAAFVVSELNGLSGKAFFIVWVESNGKVIMSKRIASDLPSETLLGLRTYGDGQPWPVSDWAIGFLDSKTLVVTGGEVTRFYSAKDGKRVVSKTVDDAAVLFDSYSKFGGWLQKSAITHVVQIAGGGSNGGNADIPYQDIKELSAWKF